MVGEFDGQIGSQTEAFIAMLTLLTDIKTLVEDIQETVNEIKDIVEQ